jgi:hypothetical protein
MTRDAYLAGVRQIPGLTHHWSSLAIGGVFTPVLAKHTRSFNLVDTLSVGVDRIPSRL